MTSEPHIPRRTLLKTGLALPAVGAWPVGAMARSRPERPPDPKSAVRNVIFLCADGMSSGSPSMAEPFSQMVRGTGTQWYELASAPEVVRGMLDTASLDSLVTDSAAAASAWATGSRVFNGSINTLPDGRKLTPIGHLARDAGKAVGVVSTATITHATPAAVCAAVPDRIEEFKIAPQFMDVADVLLGGGHPFFAAETRPDGRDLYAEYRRNGYLVCRTREELLAAPRARRVMGVFSDSHLPYRIDVMGKRATPPPRLAEMTRVALQRLEQADQGFVLHVEGARVDHAAHANDAAAMLWEQLEFDDAIAEVRRFARRHPDTLVVVTTDHAVGNPGLMGVGAGYGDSDASFERMAEASGSFDWVIQTLIERSRGASLKWDAQAEFQGLFKEATGIEMSAYEASVALRALRGLGSPSLSRALSAPLAVLGQIASNTIGVGWTGTAHTSDLVLLLAFGPGSEAFGGILHHTDVFGILTAAIGVSHRNPSMTRAEAMEFPRPAQLCAGGIGAME